MVWSLIQYVTWLQQIPQPAHRKYDAGVTLGRGGAVLLACEWLSVPPFSLKGNLVIVGWPCAWVPRWLLAIIKTQLCFHKTLLNPFGTSSWPFQSIPLHVPFSFLSPTRHCTKWCFVSRQRTDSPPLVTPVSALPSCPMASAPIRIYCQSSFIPLAGRGPCSAKMSNVKGVLTQLWPARTLIHSDGWKWLEGSQVKREKKHSQKKGTNLACASEVQEANTAAIRLTNQ